MPKMICPKAEGCEGKSDTQCCIPHEQRAHCGLAYCYKTHQETGPCVEVEAEVEPMQMICPKAGDCKKKGDTEPCVPHKEQNMCRVGYCYIVDQKVGPCTEVKPKNMACRYKHLCSHPDACKHGTDDHEETSTCSWGCEVTGEPAPHCLSVNDFANLFFGKSKAEPAVWSKCDVCTHEFEKMFEPFEVVLKVQTVAQAVRLWSLSIRLWSVEIRDQLEEHGIGENGEINTV